MADIRSLQEQDLASLDHLADAFAQAHADNMSIKPDHRRVFRDWMRKVMDDENVAGIVATDGTAAVGIIVGAIVDYGPLFLPAKLGSIRVVSVAPEFRRQGVAKQLHDAMLDWFRSRSITEIHVNVHVQNKAAARFWRDLGYDLIYERVYKHL